VNDHYKNAHKISLWSLVIKYTTENLFYSLSDSDGWSEILTIGLVYVYAHKITEIVKGHDDVKQQLKHNTKGHVRLIGVSE